MLLTLANNISINSTVIDFFQKSYTISENNSLIDYIDFPISDNFKFSDDLWEFYEYDSLDRSPTTYKFNFTTVPATYKVIQKHLVLERLLISEEAISSVRQFFIKSRCFFNFLIKENILNPNQITLTVLKKFFLTKKNVQEHCKVTYKRYILDILLEIESNNTLLFSKDIFNFLDEKDLLLIKAEKESGKTNIIPRSIFNNIVSLALKDIKNPYLDIDFKRIACIMVILCETGMRIGELSRLEIDKLNPIEITDEITLYYLEFKTYKTIQLKDFTWTDCFANEKLILAYNQLTELNKNIRKSKYLYVSRRHGTKVAESTLSNHILKFFALHKEELNFESLSKHELNLMKKRKLNKELKRILGPNLRKSLCNIDFLYYASPHQFRVTICTQLYNQGIDLEWIRIHMNHLSDDMTLHYIRLNKMREKDKLIAETLKSRMNEDGSLLETDIAKAKNTNVLTELSIPELKQYYTDINNFLIKNKLNIKKDLKEIISILTRVGTPLMEMEYGYCAQHALSRVCARQEYISSLDDSYHLKPQLPNLTYLDLSYQRFKEKCHIVNYNKKIAKKNNKYSAEYEREKEALKNFVVNRLVPELNLAKKTLSELGIKKFSNQYPNLNKIVPKIDNILDKEIIAWI